MYDSIKLDRVGLYSSDALYATSQLQLCEMFQRAVGLSYVYKMFYEYESVKVGYKKIKTQQ